MPLDAVCLRAVVQELEPSVVNARVDKIYQPARDEIILALRGREGAVKAADCQSGSPPAPADRRVPG